MGSKEFKRTVMSLEAILERLKEPGFNIKQCARVTGLHFNTISYIKNGHTPNPSWGVIKKLSEYLENNY